jgi:hypothetical protein
MSDREEEFNSYENFNFSELIKIRFHAAPRNATDYYYHPKTKTIYSYYFGDDPGCWESNVKNNFDNIKFPPELSTEIKKSFSLKNKKEEKKLEPEHTVEEIKILELKFKLSENYKLELEIAKLEAERKLVESKIELKKLKQKRS